MKPDGDLGKRHVRIRWFRCCGLGFLLALLLSYISIILLEDLFPWVQFPWTYVPPHERPPDLSRCTRIEIRYEPSVIDQFFVWSGQLNLLSPEEVQYVQSLETIAVEDERVLRNLAHKVRRGLFMEPAKGIGEKPTCSVVCYHGGTRLTSFSAFTGAICLDGGRWFELPGELDDLYKTLTSAATQILPFKVRLDCAGNLGELRIQLGYSSKRNGTYPSRSKWCDIIVQRLRRAGREEWASQWFRCPGASQGKCNYAMNPNCEPNSPPDVVLLFETKAGWNQHGGPELFTFDNHDPRGGCVKFNDGSGRFIRTKEELQKLRWK